MKASLIESATKAFAERGYWATSIDQIAERAGVTKGAVYSNFASKEDLLLAVTSQQRVVAGTTLLTDASVPLATLFRRIGEEVARLATSKKVKRVAPRELELMTLALTSEHIRGTLARAIRGQRRSLAALVKQRAAEQGVDLALPADEIAALVTALRIGLVQQRFIDPEAIPARYFADGFSLALAGAPKPSRKARTSTRKSSRAKRTRGRP